MITKFKLYENERNAPEIGDYVLCKNWTPSFSRPKEFIETDNEINRFLNNNIGKIVKVRIINVDHNLKAYYIEYENIPDSIKKYFDHNEYMLDKENILFYSKNKESVIIQIQANKFGI